MPYLKARLRTCTSITILGLIPSPSTVTEQRQEDSLSRPKQKQEAPRIHFWLLRRSWDLSSLVVSCKFERCLFRWWGERGRVFCFWGLDSWLWPEVDFVDCDVITSCKRHSESSEYFNLFMTCFESIWSFTMLRKSRQKWCASKQRWTPV